MHVTAVVPLHVPVLSHAKAEKHLFVPLHVVPVGAWGLEHIPVDMLHVPAVWHWSLAVHVPGFEPVQTPAMQL